MLVGTSFDGAVPFLLALTAGNFFYIALADMVQSLHQISGFKQSIIQVEKKEYLSFFFVF